jgi:hypothetical protein
MPQLRRLALIVVGLCLVLPPAPANAQTKCREGKTATGNCVKASREEALRRRTIIFTQPKLSYTGSPVLPGKDREYDVLRTRQPGLEYELFGPPAPPGPHGPAPCTGRRC